MRGLQGVVIGPQVGLRSKAGYLREACRRRVVQELDLAYPGRRVVELGNCVDAGDPRKVFGSRLIKRAAGILQGSRQTGRTDRVGRVQERESRPVVDAAETGAEDGFVVLAEDPLQQTVSRARCISDRDSPREIRLFKVVKARAVVHGTTEVESNRLLRGIPQSLLHVLDVQIKLRPQT